jgi:RNase P subunit RPR2
MKDNKLTKDIAEERISRLLSMALEKAKQNTRASKTLSKRYVRLARLISMHYKVKFTRMQKYSFCKSCNISFVPGVNCTVKIASSKRYVSYVCECGAETHIFYKDKPLNKKFSSL